MGSPTGVWFEVSLDDRGRARSVYVRLVSSPEVARTKEIAANRLLADYDEAGTLVGLEILAPVALEEVQRLLGDASMGESIARRVPDLVMSAA